MAGPYMCESMLEGKSCQILALTAGERGNPKLEPEIYKIQKIAEAREFSRKTGIHYEVFDDIEDAHLLPTSEVIQRVKDFIVDGDFTQVLTHWRGSSHPDHRQAHEIVSIAVLQLNLIRDDSKQIDLFFCENWEDMNSFKHDKYFPVGKIACENWRRGIEHIAFIDGSFSNFRYLDYYTCLLTIRGCLSNNTFAVSMMSERNL